MINSEKYIYEKIIFLKKIPYWMFWPLVALFCFLFGSILIYLTKEEPYPWTLLIFIIFLAAGPPFLIYFRRSFEERMNNLSSLLWESTEEFNEWLQVETKKIFSLKSFPAISITTLILLMGVATVLLLGLPFTKLFMNIIAIIGFSIVNFICGHYAYIILALMKALHEITKRNPNLSFFQFNDPLIIDLQNLYSSIAVVVTCAYVGLIFAVINGPYELGNELQIWLSVLAIFPILSFTWSYLHIHNLLRNIKYANIKRINTRVLIIFNNVNENCNLEDIEKLEKIIDIQNKVRSISEWPFDLQGIATFIIAMTTAIVQIITLWNGNAP